jgi:dihydroorotate dehydrogenase (NAD+) catalytic subunit
MMNMKVTVSGVDFKNPVIAASGTFGFGREFEELYDLSLLGGISLKGMTLARREGNESPRIAETPSGILNSVGLQNPGADYFLKHDLPHLQKINTVLIANAAGNTEEDYIKIVEKLSGSAVHMIELNISCPNVEEGGMAFGANPQTVKDITEKVKKVCKKPLMVKLSPNVASIRDCAVAAEQGGADSLSLINTLTGMAVDIHTRRPVLGNIFGGLSGPAVKPVALKMVFDVYRAVGIPVVGMGGIMTAADVIEFMLCGARAVQVGTANMRDPMACPKIIAGLAEFMVKYGVKDINEMVGGIK